MPRCGQTKSQGGVSPCDARSTTKPATSPPPAWVHWVVSTAPPPLDDVSELSEASL